MVRLCAKWYSSGAGRPATLRRAGAVPIVAG